MKNTTLIIGYSKLYERKSFLSRLLSYLKRKPNTIDNLIFCAAVAYGCYWGIIWASWVLRI